MEDTKELDDITKAINKMAIEATPNRRRSKRVRHLKARVLVQNKENTNNKNKTQNKAKNETKPKPKLKAAKLDKKTSISSIPESVEYTTNDVVFPLFSTVQYKSILNEYDIEIPSYLSEWLYKLLTMINKSDIRREVDAYSWMVLLYPSLILIIESKRTKSKLKSLVSKTLNILSNFIASETSEGSELNNALICTELYTNKSDKIPIFVWNNINTLMESTNTFNKFLKISCARCKDIKLVQELLSCSAAQILEKKTLYPKIRSKWESFIGVYTQMVRLHRLYRMDTNYLSERCKENIMKMCDVFDNTYCKVLRDLLMPLKQKSDTLKMDYSYYRYKTMAMATHTPSSIPPTFAGYFGCIDADDMDIDMSLWKVMVDALHSDTECFMKTVRNILSKEKKKDIHLLNVINKMPKKEIHLLRILDNICYNSICSMLMYQSYVNSDDKDEDINTYYTKLMKIRKDICDIIQKLAQHSLLFCKEITGLDNDLLQSCFLTYDKEGKKVWSVHLMSGVLLNYWIPKLKTK